MRLPIRSVVCWTGVEKRMGRPRGTARNKTKTKPNEIKTIPNSVKNKIKGEKTRKKKESEYDNNERQGRKMFLRASATRTLSIGLGSKNKNCGRSTPRGYFVDEDLSLIHI